MLSWLTFPCMRRNYTFSGHNFFSKLRIISLNPKNQAASIILIIAIYEALLRQFGSSTEWGPRGPLRGLFMDALY